MSVFQRVFNRSTGIVRLGHPVLRERASPLTESELQGPEMKRGVEELYAALNKDSGDMSVVGVAAPQVGWGRRVVLLKSDSPSAKVPETLLVNPSAIVVGKRTIDVLEGCLSVPGMCGVVKRPAHVLLRYTEAKTGRLRQVDCKGWTAALVSHELDHLEGTVFVDKAETLSFVEEWRHFGKPSSLCESGTWEPREKD